MSQALITSDPKIMMSKPTVAGTRITAELILEKLAAGETVDQILSEHPRLTPEGIRAAMACSIYCFTLRDRTGGRFMKALPGPANRLVRCKAGTSSQPC